MDEEAVDYFMKSLESKSKSLPDQILFDFLRCGMNALKNLKKKEELGLKLNFNFVMIYSAFKIHLKRHVNTIHLGLRPHKYTQCGKTFGTNGALNTHITYSRNQALRAWF